MNIQLDAGAIKPTKAHEEDAGYDLYSPVDVVIKARDNATIDSGVHIELPKGRYGRLASKSGLNVKHNITGEGTIDCGYSGSIVVKLYNHGDEDYYMRSGDKMIQLIIQRYEEVDLTIVDKIQGLSRGDNGFGSSGR